MKPMLTVLVLLSLAAAGLSGCYVVSPYAYPGYVPAYPPPAYVPPSSRAPSPPPQGGPPAAPPASGGSPSQAPGAQGGPQGTATNCQTVTVEGHSETRVTPSGQRETIWIPTHEQQLCQ